MSEVWSLPGYDVQALLGCGATGEVWRARQLATGDTVALKRLRPGADPDAVQALRREAALLAALATPYVVRLREVLGDGADVVLVLDHAAGGSLATLLARRGALDPGEVVTIGAPLAQALAVAHERGLVHGDVTPANVLFTADGMPLLSDLGLGRLAEERTGAVDGTAEYLDPVVAAGGPPDAAADVWALAAVCHQLLAGAPPHDGGTVAAVLGAAAAGERAPLGLLAPTAPRALVEAVEAGLTRDPADRPDAAAFASLLRRAHGAAPVQLTGGAAAAATVPPARATHAVRRAPAHVDEARSRRLPQHALLASVMAVLVAVAGTVGWWSGRSGAEAGAAVALPPAGSPAGPTAGSPAAAAPVPRTAAPIPSVAPSAAPSAVTSAVPAPGTDWAAVLDRLDGLRARAFAEGDVAALADAYAAGSPGLAADTALVQELADRGQVAEGVRHRVQSVEVLAGSAGAARLRVVDVLSGYVVRDAAGRVVSRAPERGAATFVAELVRAGGAWRLVEVRPET